VSQQSGVVRHAATAGSALIGRNHGSVEGNSVPPVEHVGGYIASASRVVIPLGSIPRANFSRRCPFHADKLSRLSYRQCLLTGHSCSTRGSRVLPEPACESHNTEEDAMIFIQRNQCESADYVKVADDRFSRKPAKVPLCGGRRWNATNMISLLHDTET
jgi:hypothetical protein